MRGLGYPLRVNGQLVSGPVRLVGGHMLMDGRPLPGTTRVTHAPQAAGSYYVGAPPVGEYSLVPNAPGMGAYVQYPVRGLGQSGAAAGLGLAAAALYIGVVGAAGWYAGKAMAPDRSREGTYKWAGALSNLVAPGLGLGAVGIVSLAAKGGRSPVGA